MRTIKVFLKIEPNVCLIWVWACHFQLETWFQIQGKFCLALDGKSTTWSRLGHNKADVFVHLAASAKVSALKFEFGFFFIAKVKSCSALESLAHGYSKWNHKSIVWPDHRKWFDRYHKLLKLGQLAALHALLQHLHYLLAIRWCFTRAALHNALELFGFFLSTQTFRWLLPIAFISLFVCREQEGKQYNAWRKTRIHFGMSLNN